MAQVLTKSFAQLELQQTITDTELYETLHEYVSAGAAIDHHVVCGIIDRVNPDDAVKRILLELAQAGIDKQAALQQHAAAYHYQVVLTHIRFGRRL